MPLVNVQVRASPEMDVREFRCADADADDENALTPTQQLQQKQQQQPTYGCRYFD